MTQKDEPVEVAAFALEAEAELARGLLETSGIDASIFTDDAGSALTGMGVARLVVRAEDAETARALLDATEDGTAEPDYDEGGDEGEL